MVFNVEVTLLNGSVLFRMYTYVCMYMHANTCIYTYKKYILVEFNINHILRRGIYTATVFLFFFNLFFNMAPHRILHKSM